MSHRTSREAAEMLVDGGCNSLERVLAEALLDSARRSVARHYMDGNHSCSFGVKGGTVICTGSSYEPFKAARHVKPVAGPGRPQKETK